MKNSAKPPAVPGESRIDKAAIGAGLRALFDEVVKEPVPDEFLELLRQADERDHAGPPGETCSQ